MVNDERGNRNVTLFFELSSGSQLFRLWILICADCVAQINFQILDPEISQGNSFNKKLTNVLHYTQNNVVYLYPK